jgi:hypothetical protein
MIPTYLASYNPQAETDFFRATSDNYSSFSAIRANNYYTFYIRLCNCIQTLSNNRIQVFLLYTNSSNKNVCIHGLALKCTFKSAVPVLERRVGIPLPPNNHFPPVTTCHQHCGLHLSGFKIKYCLFHVTLPSMLLYLQICFC